MFHWIGWIVFAVLLSVLFELFCNDVPHPWVDKNVEGLKGIADGGPEESEAEVPRLTAKSAFAENQCA
jgi:hypothetical protein